MLDGKNKDNEEIESIGDEEYGEEEDDYGSQDGEEGGEFNEEDI